VVGAYQRTNPPAVGPYNGSPENLPTKYTKRAEATVSSQKAKLTGLVAGTPYVAWANVSGEDRYVQFETEAASVTGSVTSVNSAEGAVSLTAGTGLEWAGNTEVKVAAEGITTATIKALAVTAAKLAAESVETAKIKGEAVTEAKLAAAVVTKLNEKVTPGNEEITTAMIKALAVTAAKLAAESVETGKIKDEAVTTAKIASAAVTATKIAENAVEAAAIKAEAVTAAKIATGAVTETKLGAGSVVAAKLGSEAVETAAIKASNVTGAKLDSTTKGQLEPQVYERSWVIPGEPKAQVYQGFEIKLGAHETKNMIGMSVKLASGTSCKVKVLKGGVLISSYEVTAESAKVNRVASTKALSNEDDITMEVSSLSGTPENLRVSVFIEAVK